jgi:hypothetical protein
MRRLTKYGITFSGHPLFNGSPLPFGRLFLKGFVDTARWPVFRLENISHVAFGGHGARFTSSLGSSGLLDDANLDADDFLTMLP